MRATRIQIGFEELEYDESFKKFGLKYLRSRAELIKIYKPLYWGKPLNR